MKQATLLVFLMFATVCAFAGNGMEVLEDGYETDAAALTLPANNSGRISFRACEKCRGVSLDLSVATLYRIGKRDVSLPELRGYLAENPTANVLVVTRKSQRTVTRIVASAHPQ